MNANHDPSLAAISKRDFLRRAGLAGAILATSSSWLGALGGCARLDRGARGTPGLMPSKDPTTGLALLRLPPGFRYFSFGWAGEKFAAGGTMPRAADGMTVIGQMGSRVRLVRNQEIWFDEGAFAPAGAVYDPGAGGGTVLLDVDLDSGRSESTALLVGTAANCAGGHWKHRQWLTCEELVHEPGVETRMSNGRLATRFSKPHGYVFLGGPQASAQPIVSMGRFRHEAVALHEPSGQWFLTEDNKPAGFYRFLPARADDLHAGGRLQALVVVDAPDLRHEGDTKKLWNCRWIDIADPDRGHHQDSDQSGVVMQAQAAGASLFSRLEAVLVRGDRVVFNSTDGGPAEAGQIFEYDAVRQTLRLAHVSNDPNWMDYPDQMVATKHGLFIAQDSKRVSSQNLWWLSDSGELRTLAMNDVEIDGVDHRDAEWSGLCFSPDGKWLFANIYTPGFSVAITGDWRAWMR